MFLLKSKFALDKPIHRIDCINYSPNSLTTINNNTSNILFSFPIEDAYMCLQNSYISLEFEVLNNGNTRYADIKRLGFVIFGPVALFSGAKITTSSGKHLKELTTYTQ